jgi:hypothetical protein
VRLLSFDEPTGRHDPVLDPEEKDEKPVAAGAESLEAVLAVVERVTSQGGRITRTGKWGVHETKAAELAGLSRAKVWAAVDSLLADGRLAVDNTGSLSLQPSAD